MNEPRHRDDRRIRGLCRIETGELKKRFMEKARSQRQQAEVLREVVLHGDRLSHEDSKVLR